MEMLSFRDFLVEAEAADIHPLGGQTNSKKARPMNSIAATNFFFDIDDEEADNIWKTTPQVGGDSAESLTRKLLRPQTVYKISPKSGKITVMSGDDDVNASFDNPNIVKGWREKVFRKGKDGGIYRVRGKNYGFKGHMSIDDQGKMIYRGMDQSQSPGMSPGGLPGGLPI